MGNRVGPLSVPKTLQRFMFSRQTHLSQNTRRSRRSPRCFATGFCFSVVASSLLQAESWPSIRGIGQDGQAGAASQTFGDGPVSMDVVWKRSIGSGYSGIIVDGDTMFTAAADNDSGTEKLYALSAVDGTKKWATETGKIFKGANGSFDGPIATPATDGENVYHLTPQGRLMAVAAADGTEVWSKSLPEEFGSQPNFYGFGASPIAIEGAVVLPVGGEDSAVVAFDAESGKTVWQVESDSAAFQTVVPMGSDATADLLAVTNTKLMRIDPSDGSLRFSQTHGGAAGMGAWSVIPVPLSSNTFFLNDSENVSRGIRVGDDAAEEVWQSRAIRNTYCVPVLVNGLLCGYSSRFLVAVDPNTGERVWRVRDPGNGFVAAIGDRLLVITMDGDLHLGEVDQEGFNEVAQTNVFDVEVDRQVWSLPSVVGESVFVRSLQGIARIDLKSSAPAAEAIVEDALISRKIAALQKRIENASPQQIDAMLSEFLTVPNTPIIEGDLVTFVLRGDHDDVAVASDLFGVRQERPMRRLEGTDLFHFTHRMEQPGRASYVFFADFEPTVDPRNARRVVSSTLSGAMEPMFRGPEPALLMNWFDTTEAAEQRMQTVDAGGTLKGFGQMTSLKSKIMDREIPLTVYVPPGYDAEGPDGPDYPVVFVHDGKVAMDSGMQLSIVDRLISDGTIPPTIVVFIDWRFFPLAGMDGYPQMFASELVPMITSKYRVSEAREDRAVLGGGFGGTLAMMSTLPIASQVGRIGMHSPFAFELIHPAIGQLASMPKDKVSVRIDHGEYEVRNPDENWDMKRQSVAIADILRDAGHNVEVNAVGGASDWVCWRTRSVDMWKFLVDASAAP